MRDVEALQAEAKLIGVKIEEAMRGCGKYGTKISFRLYKRPFRVQNWFEYGDLYVWAMPIIWENKSDCEVFFRGKLVFKFQAHHSYTPIAVDVVKYRRGAWTELVDKALAYAREKAAEREEEMARRKQAQVEYEEREKWGIGGD